MPAWSCSKFIQICSFEESCASGRKCKANRYAICQKHSKKFQTVEVELEDRDHVKLWIAERQLGRRNLTDSQRAVIANDVREIRSDILRSEQAKEAISVRHNPTSRLNQPTRKTEPTRKAVAEESKLPERKIRLAQEIKKAAPEVSQMVRAGARPQSVT